MRIKLTLAVAALFALVSLYASGIYAKVKSFLTAASDS